MDETAETPEMALRPKSMPGSASTSGSESRTDGGMDAGVGAGAGSGRRQRAAHRRRRRPLTAVLGVVAVLVLVLTGVGLGTVGATVISMGKLADLKEQRGEGPPGGAPDTPAKPGGKPRPSGPEPQGGQSATAPDAGPDAAPDRTAARATLGIEAVDVEQGAGALLVGVHIPGPGYSAGLVRGDVLLAIGGHPVRTAAELAAEVAAARPGKAVTVTVRHEDGARESLSVRPGVVT